MIYKHNLDFLQLFTTIDSGLKAKEIKGMIDITNNTYILTTIQTKLATKKKKN